MRIRDTCKPPWEIGIVIPICCIIALVAIMHDTIVPIIGPIILIIVGILGPLVFGWFSECMFSRATLMERTFIITVSSIVSGLSGYLIGSVTTRILNCSINAITCTPDKTILLAGLVVGIGLGLCGWFYSWFRRCVILGK